MSSSCAAPPYHSYPRPRFAPPPTRPRTGGGGSQREGGSDDRAMTDHDLFLTDRGRGPLRCVARSIGSIAARAEGGRETAKNRQFTRLTGRAAPPVLRPQRFAVLPLVWTLWLPSLSASTIRDPRRCHCLEFRSPTRTDIDTFPTQPLPSFLPSFLPRVRPSDGVRPSRWRNADNRNG